MSETQRSTEFSACCFHSRLAAQQSHNDHPLRKRIGQRYCLKAFFVHIVLLIQFGTQFRAAGFPLWQQPWLSTHGRSQLSSTPGVTSFSLSSHLSAVGRNLHHGVSHCPRNSTGFHSTLAIVPPLEAWDRLQRARHFARDPLFHTLPPCVSMIHPFHATALEVADVIEELALEAFDVQWSTFVIVPHLEAVENNWETASLGPDTTEATYLDVEDSRLSTQAREDAEIQALIAQEEQIGREKAQARARREAAKQKKQHEADESNARKQLDGDSYDGSTVKDTTGNMESAPLRQFRQQQEALEDFGGPCILCLEPSAESKAILQEIREELVTLLNHEDYSSPSSLYSQHYINEPIFQVSEWRPIITLGSFDSFPAAMEVARRLKGLWGEPLTFSIKDLQLVSCLDEESQSFGGRSNFEYQDRSEALLDNREAMLFSASSSNAISEDDAWGCNAKIKLIGEEDDSEDNNADFEIAEHIEKLCEEGQAGGNDISNDYTILDDEEELSNVEMWLNDDQDFDEGIQVTIGRTQFFTGDRRTYKGMPATSVTDAKDRSLGDVGAVSGLARRRRTSTRSGTRQWENGEYGRRQTDYLPWSKREKPKKVERLLDISEENFNQSTDEGSTE